MRFIDEYKFNLIWANGNVCYFCLVLYEIYLANSFGLIRGTPKKIEDGLNYAEKASRDLANAEQEIDAKLDEAKSKHPQLLIKQTKELRR